jgi:inner membrane protein
MTGRTHDLAAFTLLNAVFVWLQLPHMSLATTTVAFGANMIGGLLPDIDNVTADIWNKIPGGSVLAFIVKPIVGGHRTLSHSLIGMGIIGFLLKYVLAAVGKVLLVDMNIIWWAVMIGYFSHLVMDSLTTEGVPWLLPIPVRIGFPPIKELRIKTGGLIENLLVFPTLLAANGYLIYVNYPAFLHFFRSILT